MLALAERIEAAIIDCEQALDMIAGRTGGTRSIGAVTHREIFRAVRDRGVLQAFIRRSTSRCTIGNREEIREAMRGYDLDIAMMGRPPADVDVDVRLLGRASAHHRRAQADTGWRRIPASA